MKIITLFIGIFSFACLTCNNDTSQLEVSDLTCEYLKNPIGIVILEPGETEYVSFNLKSEDFSYGDDTKKDWSIEAGDFEIMIGSSSEDIKFCDT